MPFSHLLGNQPAKTYLQHMLAKKHVPNTLLFAGPDGVGKSLFALALAKALMGSSRANHPDVHSYFPEGKSGMHTIDSLRQLIAEVYMPPFEAPCKAFIIHDAERMLPAAANALLKTFEEPTLDSYIILLSSEPEALLPTIVSRCRKVPFFPIAEEDIAACAAQTWNQSPEQARRIAFLSQGSLSKAKHLATEEKQDHLLIDILANPHDPMISKSLAKLEESLGDAEESEGRWMKNIDALFDQILYWYRDLHLLAQGGDPQKLFYQDHLDKLKQVHPIPSLERVFTQVTTCRKAVQHNVKLRTALEHLFLNI